jgi:hypothetical protein
MGETLAYAPRKAIKSQILADFVAEWTDTQLPPPQIQAECWTLYFDGSVMKTGASAGLLFVLPLSAARSESNRAWCWGGDTPWYQEAGLSRSTLPV